MTTTTTTAITMVTITTTTMITATIAVMTYRAAMTPFRPALLRAQLQVVDAGPLTCSECPREAAIAAGVVATVDGCMSARAFVFLVCDSCI